MGTWVFLRHGESTANAEGFLAGWDDVPLTALGEAQAREAGRQLASVSLDRVLCSDLVRARRTAEIALDGRGLEIQEDRALRERHLGAWSGLTLATVREDGRMATLLGWDSRPPGGESHADMAARALPFLARWEEGSAAILVVAHGGLIRTLVGLLDDSPLNEIGQIRIPNAVPLARDLLAGTWARLFTRLSLRSFP